MGDPKVVFDTTHVRDLQERSDIDSHQTKQEIRRQLDGMAEDWGDGFFVEAEPVFIQRGPDGAIVRTTPMGEYFARNRQDDEPELPPVEVDPVPSARPRPRSEWEKLVEILAMRLFRVYKQVGPHPTKYNPVYDGIPDKPAGAGLVVPLPGSRLFLASETEVFEWLKNSVIGPRVRIVEKKMGRDPYNPEAVSNFDIRITRNPG